jgi:hypothetical protein
MKIIEGLDFSGKRASEAHYQSRKFRGFDWSGIVRKNLGMMSAHAFLKKMVERSSVH